MNSAAHSLHRLVIYRNLLQDRLVPKIQAVLGGDAADDQYYELSAGLITQAEQLGLRGNLWQNYLVYLIARDENVFSLVAEKNRGAIGSGLRRAAAHDLRILYDFLHIVPSAWPDDAGLITDFTPTRPGPFQDFAALTDLLLAGGASPAPADMVNKLAAYYLRHGSGKTAGYAAFRWDEKCGLTGIKYPDEIRLEDIIGYEQQKEALMQNTESLLAGKPANNVLLIGARGTGKSSSVKALANRYFYDGLRLVELPKHQLRHLHQLMEVLRDRGQKYVIFLDDLSFEDSETEYKYLKSVIDGGIAAKPGNVLLYATSNRRHLIRENWADRAEQDIHSADSIHEKISLSDRFGLTLTYPAPDQNEYLRIVEGLALQQAVNLPAEELKKRALRWEIAHSGRSGRVARQFVNHILGAN